MFDKKDRSKFKYWFAHWCAFQMTSLNLGVWKFKYLFHDIEKPFMLYWFMWVCRMTHEDAYKKVQKWHRLHRKHHLEYRKEKDYEEMMIDWECSRFTKTKSPRTAKQEFKRMLEEEPNRLNNIDVNNIICALISLGLAK